MPTPTFRIDHVQLSIPTGSEDACREFWVAGLGFTEIEKPENLRARGGLWVQAGTLEIHLGVEEAFTPALKAHPGIEVDDIRVVAAMVEAAGSAVTWDEAIPGVVRFHSHDNVGNRLEFLSHRSPA